MIMRRTAEEWRSVVLDQAKSGLTIAQYCKQQNISQSGLYHWRSEYKDELNILNKPIATPFKSIDIEPDPVSNNHSPIISQFNLTIGNWFKLSVNRSC